ncbi:Potassium transporter 6 [Tetrabaena socialis]|uniref:Potassium transporter 6 n=1 Tax=Tetrabaena socialis TaxID=47790 RepID=A0A2J7ZXY2_9CHLO|nr:Potassium transporter 6 [Tetrabaena socialis]|eukprot:PNH05126.1 Potassium transporter 6 [Tetrabaena socialis]
MDLIATLYILDLGGALWCLNMSLSTSLDTLPVALCGICGTKTASSGTANLANRAAKKSSTPSRSSAPASTPGPATSTSSGRSPQRSSGAAHVLHHPRDTDAFWASLPRPLLYPMLVLATLATIVASQALISGVFSILRQAIVLGAFPPVRVVHTGGRKPGAATQVYVPLANVLLLLLCCAVVAGFRDTVALGKAYGLAVMTDMVITTCLVTLVMVVVWELGLPLVLLFFLLFFSVEATYWSANIIKRHQEWKVPPVVQLRRPALRRRDGVAVNYLWVVAALLPLDRQRRQHALAQQPRGRAHKEAVAAGGTSTAPWVGRGLPTVVPSCGSSRAASSTMRMSHSTYAERKEAAEEPAAGSSARPCVEKPAAGRASLRLEKPSPCASMYASSASHTVGTPALMVTAQLSISE